MEEDKKVLNGYGVLFALCVAKESGKNPSEIIDLLNTDMTTEEKAKRYDEAIEIAKEINNEQRAQPFNIMTIVFPELKESEDERIRKELLNYLYDVHDDDEERARWIAWLEKQGEHANFLSKIQVGDKVTRNEDGVLVNLSQLNRVAKPADKVEPKFKVGDWVVTKDGKVNQVKTVSDDGDAYDLDDDTYFSGSWKDMYHLWTIQDVKDGDVLAEHETIVLFKKIEGQNIRCYCTYHYLGFNPILRVDTLQNKKPYHPATKEQRDLLFQKMKESGYEWDTEKKELRKIEQKPTWSKEDEEIIINIGEYLNRYGNYIAESNEEKAANVYKSADWLKSLKDRYTWKPSDEQMQALANALSLAKNCGEESAFDLRTLYEQLKKL